VSWLFVVRVWAVASGSRERVVTFEQDAMGIGYSLIWKIRQCYDSCDGKKVY
jgi:hypothetical protein